MANAFDRAAAREKEFHPKNAAGQTITAWSDRAKLLNALAVGYADLEKRVAALEAQPPPKPFP